MKHGTQFIFYTKGLEHKSFYDEKAGKKRYFVKGHVTSGDLDLVGDIITKACRDDISTQFKNRNMKLDFDHETLRATDGDQFEGRLNLTKIPLGKTSSESVDEKGNLAEFELNPNWKRYDSKGDVVMDFSELWNNIENGFYDAFSIAYVPLKTKSKILENDMKARLLDKVNLINVALTGNPINPNATMTQVMAKSLEWLKEKEGDKMQKKAYDKDGAHAHTTEDPIGEHNHPEIEKVVSELRTDFDARIGRLWDKFYDLTSPEKESVLKSKKGKGDKMADEPKDNPPAEGDAPKDGDKPAEGEKEGKPAEGKPAEGAAAEGAPAEKEKKGDDKDKEKEETKEMKGRLDKLEKENKELKEIVEKARPAGYGPEDANAKKEAKSKTTESKGPLDNI